MPTVYDSGTSMPSPAPGTTLTVTCYGHATGFGPLWGGYSYFATSAGNTAQVGQGNQDTFNFNDSITMTADTANSYYQAFVVQGGTSYGGGFQFFTTNAEVASASAPTSSSITTTSAQLSCNFFPNTSSSTATCYFQYRVLGTQTWTNTSSSNFSGYSQQNLTQTITGLTCGTTYQFQLYMTRTTNNDTTLTSSISSFTTSACAPVVNTDAATNLGPNGATLNGDVNPNGFSTTYNFAWGTTHGGPYPNTTATQGPSSSTSDFTFSQAITGLNPTTTYYYIAQATYTPISNPVTLNGSEVSFTTAASAAQARLMPGHVFSERKYGVQSTFYFAVEVPSATNSDRFFSAASPFVAGDVQISKDGGALANTTNLPANVAGTIWSLTLTATEMQATDIVVTLVDADGPSWRDTLLVIQTKLRLGMIDIDATQIGGNTAAMNLQGVGTSAGLNAVGGGTSGGDISGALTSHLVLKTTASAGGASTVTINGGSATTNYYNGLLVFLLSGTGAGQCRYCTAYNGAGLITVNRSWSTNPANGTVVLLIPMEDDGQITLAELASIPTATDSKSNKWQYLFQRFGFKRTQTASTQTLYKSDSATTLGSATVSDDGTTQTTGKAS